jgi:superfamily II DNA helicase RecQ
MNSQSTAERLENGANSRVEAMLRAWRLKEAQKRGVPAFRIFSDNALRAMASRRPGTTQDLLAILGIGIRTVEQYGVLICRILQGAKTEAS